MNTHQPHIKIEKGVEYQLGEHKQDYILYNFKKILQYLEVKGKSLYGKKFKIYHEDKPILYKLCTYFIKDFESCKKLQIDLNKGILLTGPVGCGKTSLMNLMRFITPQKKAYTISPCRNIVFGFNNLGFRTIEDFGNEGSFCFDDLGVEPTGRHYGKDCNVMGEILLSRYDLFLRNLSTDKQRQKSHQKSQHSPLPSNLHTTHITTNLNAEELEERYGNRVRSRMRAMFNLLSFDKTSEDKRL
ncbi:ATPase [Mesonia sp. K7]|uniref:ATPase n=1 Tax=Mesonia sp. K7 TaxID=2218606 RepID=UPI000DAA72DC|nr:ATPase [Mesonia sp. K7]PZD76811.1 ATPase [Mesonia sp. K7]